MLAVDGHNGTIYHLHWPNKAYETAKNICKISEAKLRNRTTYNLDISQKGNAPPKNQNERNIHLLMKHGLDIPTSKETTRN